MGASPASLTCHATKICLPHCGLTILEPLTLGSQVCQGHNTKHSTAAVRLALALTFLLFLWGGGLFIAYL